MPQMLLIWLFLPSVSAILDCKSACDLCQMDKDPATIYVTCALCRKCHWALNPRRMMELQMPNRNKMLVQGQVLTEKQLNELKNAELKEIKDVLDEYGYQLRDFGTITEKWVDDTNDECLPLLSKNCLVSESEEPDPLKGMKHKCPKMTCSPAPKTTRKCPPIKPCTKKHTTAYNPLSEATDDSAASMAPDAATLSRYRKRILRQIANLKKVDEDGCPIQPDCSDEDSDQDVLDKLVNKHMIFTPPPLTSLTTTTSTTERPCPEKMKCKVSSTPCVPCMPQCALPCRPPVPYPVPFPLVLPAPPPMGPPVFLPSQIPIEVMKALMTLKTTTEEIKTTEKQDTQVIDKSEERYKSNEKDKSREKDKSKEINKLKQKLKIIEKVKRKEKESVSGSSTFSEEVLQEDMSTKTTTEDEFLYLYVGVPNDVKNVKRG